jgi:tRNA A-37 threonylcarbamoyl transferase component Bud32
MADEYVRLCPSCGAENPAATLRCTCGAMLFGVDLVSKAALAAAETTQPDAGWAAPDANSQLVCPYPDCGQANPPGSKTCAYCNRALAGLAQESPVPASLLNLPPALSGRYRILRPLPTAGAEAELLLVEPAAGGRTLVAKIYRHGIVPKTEVQERLARVDPRFRLQVIESGIAGGYAYEVMEFCAFGSLRDLLRRGFLGPEAETAMVREISEALAAVHAAGIVHRDLKPENVLLRSEQPLDLVLIDYGIASVLDATQRFTGVARTLAYASPESLSGVIDGKADYWAMGMMLLEAATGRHPFAGLSDAVILHHLTTRSVDLSQVTDANLCKLLRGLLLRDPDSRWGRSEVARWLAGDATLVAAADLGRGAGLAEPYHVGNEICTTREQLGLALARDWKIGLSDLGNGQLLSWFRDVQKDQNTVRLLLDLRMDQKYHVDMRLLKLILHLAPRISPTWRGDPISLEAILRQADLALQGKEEAARWLNALYQHHVLDAYAEAGNQDCAAVARTWNGAIDDFAKSWEARVALLKKWEKQRTANDIPSLDDLMFGGAGPQRESLALLHPRLLALAYDPAWAARLRKRLSVEMAGLVVQSPWLAELGDPQTMDFAALLVLESLLPEAKQEAERALERKMRRQQEDTETVRQEQAELDMLILHLKRIAGERLIGEMELQQMRSHIERYFELMARIIGRGEADPVAVDRRRSMKRCEPVLNHMLALIDSLMERRAANSGWLSAEAIAIGLAVLAIVPLLMGALAAYVLLAALAAVSMWRFLPNYFTLQNMRKLADRL